MNKIITALVTIMTALAFSGCADAPQADGENTEIGQGYSVCYAFTASSDVTGINDKTVMKDYMDALGRDGLLEFDGYDGDFGFYITSVYGITSRVVSSTPNSYTGYDWAVYTTLTTSLYTAGLRCTKAVTAFRACPAWKDIRTRLSTNCRQ